MDVLNRKSLLLGIALCMSGAVVAQVPNTSAPGGPNATPPAAPRAAPYDCFGLAGVALRNCMDLNAAAASAGRNAPSASHDCGGMTGAALATCRELNGESVAPPLNSNNLGAYGNTGTPGYVAPGIAPANIPSAGNGNAGTGSGTGSSSGSNPTGLSPGSGTTGSSSGSDPTGLSSGSGKASSGSARPAEKSSGDGNPNPTGKSGM